MKNRCMQVRATHPLVKALVAKGYSNVESPSFCYWDDDYMPAHRHESYHMFFDPLTVFNNGPMGYNYIGAWMNYAD